MRSQQLASFSTHRQGCRTMNLEHKKSNSLVSFSTHRQGWNTELRTQKFEFRSKKEQTDPRKIKRMEVALPKFIIRRSCLCQEIEID